MHIFNSTQSIMKRSVTMMNSLLLTTTIIVLLVLLSCVSATTKLSIFGVVYEIPLDLKKWQFHTGVAYVGDFLVFAYAPWHDILEVDARSYQECKQWNVIERYKMGDVVIPLSEVGTKYYISSMKDLCQSGLKVEVEVHAAPFNFNLTIVEQPPRGLLLEPRLRIFPAISGLDHFVHEKHCPQIPSCPADVQTPGAPLAFTNINCYTVWAGLICGVGYPALIVLLVLFSRGRYLVWENRLNKMGQNVDRVRHACLVKFLVLIGEEPPQHRQQETPRLEVILEPYWTTVARGLSHAKRYFWKAMWVVFCVFAAINIIWPLLNTSMEDLLATLPHFIGANR